MSQRCWRNYLVFSSLFSDLFHRKKLNTATCIITAILGYNKKKIWNTFNKIKTFKYSKIFAWKYKTTQKALKSNLNSLEGGKKKKKAEVLGRFSRTLSYEHVGCPVMEALLNSESSASSWEQLCLFLTWVSVHDGPVHDCGVFLKADEPRWLFVHLSPASLTRPNQHTPTNPESAALLLRPTDVVFFLSNNWRKRKSEASVMRLFFS